MNEITLPCAVDCNKKLRWKRPSILNLHESITLSHQTLNEQIKSPSLLILESKTCQPPYTAIDSMQIQIKVFICYIEFIASAPTEVKFRIVPNAQSLRHSIQWQIVLHRPCCAGATLKYMRVYTTHGC